MNLYLATPLTNFSLINRESVTESLRNANILESYFYIREKEELMKYAQIAQKFILDSGAFTFMQQKNSRLDWDRYVEEYAEFINRFDVELFFELDIDKIVGLSKVEKYRSRLEELTAKKPIPVWHETRDKDYYIQMCKAYPYVAIGGIAHLKGNEKKNKELAFPWFIQTAHEHGAKIHGLGYTSIDGLKRYRFDSVDSAAWLYGNLGGYLYQFHPQSGEMKQLKKEGARVKTREAAFHNFKEWVKFSQYAKNRL